MNEPETAEGPHAANAGAWNRTETTPSTESSLPPYVLPTGADFPARIRVSDEADRYLESVADCLVLGVYGLERLRGGMLALALAGSNWQTLENARLREQLARAERDADVWYWTASNPGKRPGDLYAATEAMFWRQGAHA